MILEHLKYIFILNAKVSAKFDTRKLLSVPPFFDFDPVKFV